MARLRPRPARAAARAAGRFGGARRAAGALAGRCVRRPHCFGSAQAEAREGSSTSCWSLRRCAACCRRLGWPLCAAASLFWLGAGRGPRGQQHELLVASAVRGVLPAPWTAAVCGGLTVLARRRPRPARAAARAAGRFGGARRAAGVLAGRCVRRPHCFGSAQAEAREGSSTSCWSLRRYTACCRRLGWPLCAAARHCFGSAQAEARDSSSTSCWSLRRCAACCRRLGWPLCAAALLFAGCCVQRPPAVIVLLGAGGGLRRGA